MKHLNTRRRKTDQSANKYTEDGFHDVAAALIAWELKQDGKHKGSWRDRTATKSKRRNG